MIAFHKILFPIDFSERCRQNTPYVAGIARRFKSEVTLLHVFDLHNPFGYGAASSTVTYGAAMDVLRRQRELALADFRHEALDGLPVKRAMEAGEVADCISAYAAEHAIDLIVMPTHGRGRFRQFLLGSVTSKVLHDTDLPVWTMAHSETLASHDVRTILCAIDLSPDAIRLIQIADSLAEEFGAVVQLVHAIPAPESNGAGVRDMGLERFLFDTANRQIAAWQETAGTSFELCVKAGPVPVVVRDTAACCNADLILVDRGRLQEFLGSFRSNIHEIIRESPCPVLSV